MKIPRFIFKLIKLPPQFFYKVGLGPIIGRYVLLLTTTGRKTGKLRTTPLQYEELEGVFCVASARGEKSDWFKNIAANSRVVVQVKSQRFEGLAEISNDPESIADFLEIRLKRHPVMVKAIMRSAGLHRRPARAELMAYAENRAMVTIMPVTPSAE